MSYVYRKLITMRKTLDARVVLRITLKEKKRLDTVAAKLGLSSSELIRTLIKSLN